MDAYDIQDAKTHLSRLIETAARGEPFNIAKGGKPLVKVVPIDEPPPTPMQIGFMAGDISVPDDFDRMGSDEIPDVRGPLHCCSIRIC